MGKRTTMLLILFFLTASYIMVAKPIFSASASTAENSWATKAPMQQARAYLGAAAVNGKIYAMGGSVEGKDVATNEEYDPANNTWTYKTPMPNPSSAFATAVYQGKIYCIGGKINQVYNPANDSWKIKTPMPTARSFLQANLVNDKIYLIGGHGSTANEVYDPATDSWATKTPMPTLISSDASVVVNDKIYVIGSKPGPASPSDSLNEVYDPETDTWSVGSGVTPTAIGGQAGATTGVYAPERIYFFYGSFFYDPASDSWGKFAGMPTSRSGIAVAVLDDKLCAIGGLSTLEVDSIGYTFTTTYYPTMEEYTPFGYGTVPPKVSIASPESANYTTSDIKLNFTLNKPVAQTSYSLDGGDNVTINGNTTIADLSNGLHNVTVYASDTFGNIGASQTINFTIAKPESEGFPTVTVAAVLGACVLIVSLVIYFKKRRR
jgi:N-acetylneuraminic acid mutarotase